MVDGESIVLVKGISGSGKSTRVYLFLEFLESLGMKLHPYKFKTLDGKEKEVGVYSEDFNMVFVGKFYENGGIRLCPILYIGSRSALRVSFHVFPLFPVPGWSHSWLFPHRWVYRRSR